MNIVLTNDDGFDAPGLTAAFYALNALGTVHVVAPTTERSACGHGITLRRPITVDRIDHGPLGTVFAVDGTPADCVRLAVSALIDKPIDLVFSGINAGANAGVDTHYSGTVAGAREAAILGIPAMAMSQAIRANVTRDWDAATELAAYLVPKLLNEILPGPGFWSVNFPAPIPSDARDRIHHVPIAAHPTPMIFDRMEHQDGRMEFAYGASYWLREVTGPSDYSVIRDGGVAVTAIPTYGKF